MAHAHRGARDRACAYYVLGIVNAWSLNSREVPIPYLTEGNPYTKDKHQAREQHPEGVSEYSRALREVINTQSCVW